MKINTNIVMVIVSVILVLAFTTLGVYGITNGHVYTGIMNLICVPCWFFIGMLRLKQYLRER